MSRQVYLDYNASTPLAPEVVEALRPFLTEHFGNPLCGHWAGAPAREAIECARGQVASLIGCQPADVLFTSGASEANNTAIKGVFFANRDKGTHIITAQCEHPAVIQPCRYLEQRCGAKVTYLPVDRFGLVDPDDVRKALTPQTVMITIMHANNEVGTIQPIRRIAEIAQEHRVLFHSDAAQSVGKIRVDVDELGVDLLSIAGHKFYGPKGVGALYVREGVQIDALIHGAKQESGRRAGTENALTLVGLGKACEIAAEHIDDPKLKALRDAFWQQLQAAFGDSVVLNGHPTQRLPNTLNVNFVGAVGGELLAQLDGVAASTGAACHSGTVALSAVLEAMGVDPELGQGAIRWSVGRFTTEDEIGYVVAALRGAFQPAA